jgi:hypothetical protein
VTFLVIGLFVFFAGIIGVIGYASRDSGFPFIEVRDYLSEPGKTITRRFRANRFTTGFWSKPAEPCSITGKQRLQVKHQFGPFGWFTTPFLIDKDEFKFDPGERTAVYGVSKQKDMNGDLLLTVRNKVEKLVAKNHSLSYRNRELEQNIERMTQGRLKEIQDFIKESKSMGTYPKKS